MREKMVCDIRAMSGEQYRVFASTALAQLTRLSQIASNPALVFPKVHGSPGKFEALDGIIADILSVPSRKVIVWSNYVKSIEAILERLRGYGAISTLRRNSKQRASRHCFSLSKRQCGPRACCQSCGRRDGLYSYCSNVLDLRNAFFGAMTISHRARPKYRIGQSKPVTYMRLLAADTIEDAIVKALDRKSAMARTLLGDHGETPSISQLSKEQMCELLMMNQLPD